MAITPTQLTLRDLRGEGWTVEVVEHYNVFTKTRHDLFNIIDIVALRGGDTLGVQATSATNVAARIRKIAEHPNTPALRQAGWRLEVWGWRKKDNRWQVRKVDVS